MHKKSTNQFDQMVDLFIGKFRNIENIELLQADALANSIFKKITYRIADLNSYKILVISQFIPAVNKTVASVRNDVRRSRYRAFLPDKEFDFEDSIQDILRFGYVSLFHKLENYLTDVFAVADSLLSYSDEDQESVLIWAKRKLDFDFKHWRQFRLIHKINYISNCVKHKDGYPLLQYPPMEYENIDRKLRISLSVTEFKQDCEELNDLYIKYLQIAFMLRQYQYAEQMYSDPKSKFLSPGDEIIREEKFRSLETLILKYIDTVRTG